MLFPSIHVSKNFNGFVNDLELLVYPLPRFGSDTRPELNLNWIM